MYQVPLEHHCASALKIIFLAVVIAIVIVIVIAIVIVLFSPSQSHAPVFAEAKYLERETRLMHMHVASQQHLYCTAQIINFSFQPRPPMVADYYSTPPPSMSVLWVPVHPSTYLPSICPSAIWQDLRAPLFEALTTSTRLQAACCDQAGCEPAENSTALLLLSSPPYTVSNLRSTLVYCICRC